MKRKIYLSLAASILFSTALAAGDQSLSLTKGWGLVGSSLDNVQVNSITDSSVRSVWGWDASSAKWRAYSPNSSIESQINALVASGQFSPFNNLNKGDAFWVNAVANTTLALSGNVSTQTSKSLNPGWNLVSFSGSSSKAIEEVFKNNGQIKTVWTYDNDTWKGWSASSYINGLVANVVGSGNIIASIKPDVGYWINSQMATNIPIDISNGDTTGTATSYTIFIYQTGSSNDIIPVPNATLLVDGNTIGTTNSAGEFNFSRLKLTNGTAVQVVKDGFTTTTGTIQNGALTLAIAPLNVETYTPPTIPQTGNARKLNTNQAKVTIQASGAGNELVLSNTMVVGLVGGTLELEGSSSVGAPTMYLTMYNSPEETPTIANDIVLPTTGEHVTPKELSIIGGANITFRKSSGDLVTDLTTYDDSGLKYDLLIDRFIGDFGSILQGLTGTTNSNQQTFNEAAVSALEDAKTKGLVDFYLLQQQKDGTWAYIDTAKFVKTTNGYIMEAQNGEKLTKFGAGNLVYAIRSKALTGETTLCLKYDGQRMFDGIIVPGDVLNKPVIGATIVPDEHVISQSAATDENGCTQVAYKVPFLAPMYTVTAVKNGMYNEPVTVGIEYGNLNNDINTTASAKPTAAAIKGYVKSTLNGDEQPEADAIVSLRDPQILVADKINITSTEDNNSIELMSAPNLEYKWILSKDDSNATVTLKDGNATDGSNALTEADIESVIYNGDATQNPWSKTPYGHYYLDVTVTHHFAQGDQADFTEAMQIEFDAQVDEAALIHAFSYTNNQGDAPVYKIDANGTKTVVNDWNTTGDYPTSAELGKAKVGVISIFGGKDLSWFEPVMRPANPDLSNPYASGIITPDTTKWISDVMTMDYNTSSHCIDMSDEDDANNPYYISMLNQYASQGYCIAKVTPKTTFNGQILPFSQVYKMFIDNFVDVIKPDPANPSEPFYQSGFTVLNTYMATSDRTAMNGNVYKTYVPSYTNLDHGKLNSVNDFSNVINFHAKTNEALAFDTRVSETAPDGSYRIDDVPPAMIPHLELMARAEGTQYNTKNFRNARFPDAVYTGNLDSNVSGATDTFTQLDGLTEYNNTQAGDVYVHNFILDRIAPAIPQTRQIDFENNLVDNNDQNWTIKKLDVSSAYINTTISSGAVWNVVNNSALPSVNSNYIQDTFAGDSSAPSTILSTPYGANYAWMGDLSTGTYADNGDMNGGHQVATALVSPVIDFSNYSLATLELQTWFEVSAIDAGWDTAFVGFEIVDENVTNSSQIELTYYNGFTWNVSVNQLYVRKLTPTAPITSSYSASLFSNMGVNALPKWMDYQLPLDFLAGHKAKIVFGFFTADNLYNNFRGWGVDNIEIKDNVSYVIQTPPMPQVFEEDIQPSEGNVTTIPEANVTATAAN